MNIAPATPARRELPKPAGEAKPNPEPPAPERPKHDPGFLRDTVEKTGGVVSAVLRVPRSVVSGTALGGYHGRKRGLDADVTTPVKELALQMYVGNAIQSTAVGAVGALVVGGPGAAAGAAAPDPLSRGRSAERGRPRHTRRRSRCRGGRRAHGRSRANEYAAPRGAALRRASTRRSCHRSCR